MVRLRLQRKGRKKRPFYHIVVADQRSKRDGRYIERIGSYNPMTTPATIDLDRDKAYEWVMKGAQPTETVNAILRFKGVWYRKHLMKGVAKGILTEEQALAKYQAWIEGKEAKVESRKQEAAREIAQWHALRNGTPPPPPPVQTVAEPSVDVAQEEEVVDETTAEAPAADDHTEE